MNLLQILIGVVEGVFEPGSVLETDLGEKFEILDRNTVRITYLDGKVKTYVRSVPLAA